MMNGSNGLWRKSGSILLSSALWRNPVLTAALGLCPVAAASLTVKSAAALSLMMLFMMTPVSLLSCWIGDRIHTWVRPAVILVCSAVIYVPAFILADLLIPQVLPVLMFYTPLLITNSILLSHANDYAPGHLAIAAAADSIGCTVGFAICALLVAAARGIFANGIFWESPSHMSGPAAQPFGALILLGFLAALLQAVNRKRLRRRKYQKKERRSRL